LSDLYVASLWLIKRKGTGCPLSCSTPPDALPAQEDYTKFADYQVPRAAYVNAK
jgi:hypothetical protein